MSAPGKAKDHSLSKKPGVMDLYIGGRLRLWRRTMEVDASALAEKVGITYQQLQKYEKGMNRISATRLYAISRELNVPIDYFYQDAEAPAAMPTGFGDIDSRTLLASSAGADFLRCYASIKDPEVRRALIDLMRSIIAGPAEGELA